MSGYCRYCGAKLDSNDLFCGQCGKKVTQEKICPQCGYPISPSAKFCAKCGYDLQSNETASGSNISTVIFSQPKRSKSFFEKNKMSIIISIFEIIVFLLLAPKHTAAMFTYSIGTFIGYASLFTLFGVIPFAFSLKYWGLTQRHHIIPWILASFFAPEVSFLLHQNPSFKIYIHPAVTLIGIVIGILSLIGSIVYNKYFMKKS